MLPLTSRTIAGRSNDRGRSFRPSGPEVRGDDRDDGPEQIAEVATGQGAADYDAAVGAGADESGPDEITPSV